MADQKWVYDFSEGSKEMRELLGGKGANVAETTRVLGEDADPAGFTITTEACVEYMRTGEEPGGRRVTLTAVPTEDPEAAAGGVGAFHVA